MLNSVPCELLNSHSFRHSEGLRFGLEDSQACLYLTEQLDPIDVGKAGGNLVHLAAQGEAVLVALYSRVTSTFKHRVRQDEPVEVQELLDEAEAVCDVEDLLVRS